MTHESLSLDKNLSVPAKDVGKNVFSFAFPRKQSPSGRGFTLMELLVVVAILAILIILLFPSVSSLRDKGLASQCVSNLRGIGAAFHLNAADNNGRLVIMKDHIYGSWDKTLLERGYVESGKGLICPSCDPKEYATYQTYGVNWLGVALAPDDQNVIATSPPYTDGPRANFDIKLMSIQKPSKYLLLADSFTTRFNSQYHVVQGHTGMDEIHLRHNNRANILFADGHVDALDTKGLRDIGWRMAFDKNGVLKNF